MGPPIDRDAVLGELERVLASSAFRRAERSSTLLKYLVDQTLNGHADRLKEYTLGSEALGRGDSFDPRVDPVVRAEASRLRTRLDQYYDGSGRSDPLRITLPKGSYVPEFLPHGNPVPDAPGPVLPERRTVLSFAMHPLVAWCGAAVSCVFGLAGWLSQRPVDPHPPAQFEVELKSAGALASDVGTTVVVSLDATRMVFVSRTSDGRTHLNLRRVDRGETIRLAGTEGARGPFMSFDARWVGFWADGKIKKVALDGGAPVVLCEAADLLGASWGEDDSIIASLGVPGRLFRIPGAGGEPATVVDLSAESAVLRWPQILPGGDAIIYTAMSGTGADRANIEAHGTDGSRKVLVQGGTFGRYLHNGYLAFVNQATLYAVRFDPSTLTVQGPPIPVLDDLAYSPLFGYAQLDASHTGMLVYRKGEESIRSVISWIDRSGRETPLVSSPGRYGWMRLSPDGQRVALTAQESGITSISVYDVKAKDLTRLTSQPGEYTGLTWLPRGFLAFGGATGLGVVASSNADKPAALMAEKIAQTPWSITADGHRLAYYERHAETGFDLWTVPIRPDGDSMAAARPEPFLRTKSFEVYPSFSPDGRWMAYASNESGGWEIYVRRFPDDGVKVRVSASGGVVPRWSPNRRELLYRTSDHHVMVLPYDVVGGVFKAGPPRAWSSHTLADTGVFPNFDVGLDGEQILALLASTDPQSANHITVILNVGEAIRRREVSR